MADKKQATAEMVCEWCGETESKHPVMKGVNGHVLRECLEFDPRTQPSQELRIPDDLKELYVDANSFSPRLGDHETVDGIFVRLIERIARLEGGR